MVPDHAHKYVPQPDEPIECVICGLTPERAMYARVKPALLVHPGWILCECYDEARPYNAALELEKRQEAESKGRSRGAGGWYQAYLEDLRRGEPGGGSSGSSTRDKSMPRGESRPEQEWKGFSQAESAEMLRLEGCKVEAKGELPRWMRRLWSSQASKLGKGMDSRLMRWLLSKHLIALEPSDLREIGKAKKARFKFLLTTEHATLFKAKKAALSEALGRPVTSAEIVAAVLLKEWA